MLLWLSWLLVYLNSADCARAIWALNAGGGSHRSVDGVVYNGDVADMPGTTSDHGVHHIPLLARVHPQVRAMLHYVVGLAAASLGEEHVLDNA